MDYYEVDPKEGEKVDRLSQWEGKWHNAYDRKPGFHVPSVNPNLEAQYGKTFLPPKDEPILLPLCGKTLDLIWLREKGHLSVWGVEGVSKAIEELKEETLPELRRVQENDTAATLWTTSSSTRDIFFQSKGISIICDDFFEFCPPSTTTITTPSLFASAFDRGALVAVAPSSHEQYVAKLDSVLRPGGKILLVTLLRAGEGGNVATAAGPPFSIPPDKVKNLFCRHQYDVQLVDEHATEIKGETATEFVFVLTKPKA